MATRKFLDLTGLQEYDALIKTEIANFVSDKADTDHNHDDVYYTQTEIDVMELITTDDIDTICGQTIEEEMLEENSGGGQTLIIS